jgi:hypothetical protein
MIQLKRVVWILFLFSIVLVPVYGQEQEAGREVPVKVTFENSSRFEVQIHIIAYDMVVSSHMLNPNQNLDIDVEFGHAIRLEYPTSPHQTQLSQMGSVNELYRTVYLRNDGDNLFIEEKFSGQRIQGKGSKRSPAATISEPNLALPINREPDTIQPENKKNKIDIGSIKQQRQNARDKKNKKTRKEDPTQPENKKEKK